MSLIRVAARTAVASSVHGRIQRRQHARWAAEPQVAAAAPVPAPPAAPAAPPAPPVPASLPAGDADALISALERLAALLDSGILTDAEFQAQKARLLAG
ncbi:SHOCT domain-containing protein [Prescottella equi]|uniref:SHOCT domain-containing protein n=1 Tax=Rhodococcus hoagii TaxID=43767 RepID=UPI002575C94E|nr:SHOCT domain-containing protein [Prescottella equi]WJJ09790.1 SHOCT domain-containing protein [Prescottella equi]